MDDDKPVDDGTAQAIRLIRNRLKMSQSEVADRIGLSLRAYQDIEAGTTVARKSHHMAIQLLSLQEAVDRQEVDLATATAASLAQRFMALQDHENSSVRFSDVRKPNHWRGRAV